MGETVNEEVRQVIRDIGLWIGGILSGVIVQKWRPKKERTLDYTDKQQGLIERQGKTLNDAFDQIEALRTHVDGMERKYNALWTFAIAMADTLYENNIKLPPIPKEIESDPELFRLRKRKSEPKIPAVQEGE